MSQLYYAGPSRQPVPLSEGMVQSLFSAGTLTPETLVWQEGMVEWKPLKTVRPDLIPAGPPQGSGSPPPLKNSAGTPPPGVRSHEIDYKILGDDMQLVEVGLDPGATVIAEAGAMNYMEAGIQFETKMGDGSNPAGGFFDKLKSVGKRMLTGESLFMTHFTNHGSGRQIVAFAAPYPGRIVPLELSKYSGEIFCQKDSFLCAALGTKVGIAFAKKLGVGFFGGEGFILQRLNGYGKAFIHAGGMIVQKELKGETLRVDTGCLVGFTQGIEYDIQRAGNLKSMVFGGEGLFLATLRGHGTVWLQSLPFSRLADRITSGAGGRTDQGSMLGGLGNLFGD